MQTLRNGDHRFCGTVFDWLHDLTVVLTCVQHILHGTNITPKFVTSETRGVQLRIKVKSCSQSQMVPQNLRTQNTELVAVAQTLQGALFSFALLGSNCRVRTQATIFVRLHYTQQEGCLVTLQTKRFLYFRCSLFRLEQAVDELRRQMDFLYKSAEQ